MRLYRLAVQASGARLARRASAVTTGAPRAHTCRGWRKAWASSQGEARSSTASNAAPRASVACSAMWPATSSVRCAARRDAAAAQLHQWREAKAARAAAAAADAAAYAYAAAAAAAAAVAAAPASTASSAAASARSDSPD